MHSTPNLLALAAAALLSSTTSASPLQLSGRSFSSPLPSNSVNCNNVAAGPAPACWFQLNMTAYFNNWVVNSPYKNETANAETSGTSDDSSTSDTSGNPFEDVVTTGTFNGSNFRARAFTQSAAAAAAAADPASGQCQGSKPFSTCFLSLQLGYKPGKTDCSKINYGGANGTCPAPRTIDFANRPQEFYAVWNFYSINAYLSTLYHALPTIAQSHPAILSTAATEASPGIPYFTSASQTFSIDVPLLDLLIQSTAGHVLPGAPNTPLLALLELTPSTVRYGVQTSVSELAALMQDRLADVLAEVMADERVFIGVAGNGGFSNSTGLASAEAWEGVLGA